MRRHLIAFAVCATTTAAQADTILHYAGPAFDSVNCNRPCHFTHFSFSVRIPGALPADGLVQFCAGTQCASSLPVAFADGQSRRTEKTAGQYQFVGTVQLDASLHRVTSAFVDVAQINDRAGILLYMTLGQLNAGDFLGGNLHNANVDASASTVGAWTVKPLRKSEPN
jgi:hypothetical protein